LIKHSSSDALDKSKRIDPQLHLITLTSLTSDVRTPATTGEFTSFNLDAQYAFIYFGPGLIISKKSPKVTNIQFLETCDIDEFVITLIDGTERCGKKATL
jgi:hypothetical protein